MLMFCAWKCGKGAEMRAFSVKIRLEGREIRFQAVAKCSCDVVCQCFARFGACRVCVKGGV